MADCGPTETSEPIIQYTSREFETVLSDFLDYIRSTRPQDFTDFFQSNLGITLTELLAAAVDHSSYIHDASTVENFLATMRRYDSAVRFARSVGYTPRSAVAAEVPLTPISLPTIVVTNGATVAAGTSVTGENGVRYELISDVVIPAGAGIADARITLKEGSSFTDSFDPINQPNQEVVTARGVVEEASWAVFVGDATNPDNEWVQVDAVSNQDGDAEVYEVTFDGISRLRVRFGDGVAGKVPDDVITVTYRTTVGAEGNAPVQSVRGTVNVTISGGLGSAAITFENSAISSVDATTGEEVILGPASGGADRESLDELRTNIPGFISSVDKIITLADYDATLPQLPSVALSFSDLLVGSYTVNAVNVHVWTSEQVTFTSESPSTGTRSTSDYTRYAQLPLNLVSGVREFIAARTMPTTHAVIRRPTVAWVDLYFEEITYDEGFDDATLHQQVTDAIVRVFGCSTGFAVRVSDVYEALESIEGIRHFTLDRIVFENVVKARAVGSIQFVASQQPEPGDTVAVDDGVTAINWEFINTGGPAGIGNTAIVIQANAEATAILLAKTITSSLNITAIRDPDETEPIIRLEHNEPGTDFNIPIVVVHDPAVTPGSERLVASGMTGGADEPGSGLAAVAQVGFLATGSPGTNNPSDGDTLTVSDGDVAVTFEFDIDTVVVPGRVAVTIGTDTDVTRNNLISAIMGSALNVTASDITTGVPEVQIVQNDFGVEGNVPVTTTSGVLTVTGFAGGTGKRGVNLDDRRRIQNPSPDSWPAGDYTPGEPFVAGGGAWEDGGQTAYTEIRDIVIEAVPAERRYYDETYLYNNEIYYDSGVSLNTAIQAINLRRLVFELVAIPRRT